MLTCPSTAEGACASTLRLQTAAGKRLGATKRIIVSGATGHVRIVLPRAAARLARHGRLAARVRIATTDAAGHAADGTVAVRLRL